jgi:hypothetical protein
VTDTWFDESLESDLLGEAESDWEYLGDPESFDLDGLDSEASRAARRRKARARQLELARRRRQAALRGRVAPAPRAPAPPQAATAAVRRLDLETKVQADAARSTFIEQDKRMNRSEMAAVAGVVAGQVQNSFGDVFRDDWARAAVSFAPLLLLSPRRRGTGFGALASDPRVIGGALVAAVVVAGQRRGRDVGVRDIHITGLPELQAGSEVRFLADALDQRGAVVPSSVTWTTSDSSVASVDASGKITAHNPGVTFVTAEANGFVRRLALRVTPAEARQSRA